MDISFEAQIVKEAICSEAAIIRAALTAPHVLYKPELMPDGSKWCALFGKNLMTGVAGFGDTPEQAMTSFDEAWRNRRTPKAIRNAIEEEDAREEAAANSQFGVGA